MLTKAAKAMMAIAIVAAMVGCSGGDDASGGADKANAQINTKATGGTRPGVSGAGVPAAGAATGGGAGASSSPQ